MRLAGLTVTYSARYPARQVKVRKEVKKYLIVVEKTESGYSAYSPDLDGCISTGRSVEEIEDNMREAIQFHLDGMRLEGLAVPEPRTQSAYVEVPA